MVQSKSNSLAGVSRGFSLFELVLVLAIIGTLSAIAVPRYAASVTRYRADAAAKRIVADLSLARTKAYSSSQNVTVTYGVAAGEVTIIGVPHLKDANADYVTRLSTEPYRAEIILASFGGDTHVVFDIHGMPNSSGWILIRVGNVQRMIVLDPDTGKAAVE